MTNNQTYKFITTKINDNQIKYHFCSDNKGKILTYAEVINFLKNKDEDFLVTFRGTLNSAANKGMPAYFWECVPISKETINSPFEFVITKSESLNNITQNWKPFEVYINNNRDKYTCSFPNLSKNATLIIPIPKTGPELDFKNISKFTENAPEEQWKGFWQEVANKLSEELEKNEKPKWLSTHGLGVSYLHVRIDNSSKYYSFDEYKNFDKNAPIPEPTPPIPTPKPVANTPKEKILQNLEKVCIDPVGNLANAELLKSWTNESYSNSEASEKGFYKVEIDGKEIDLEQFQTFNALERNYQKIREAIINNIKQNISDWEIKKEFSESTHSQVLRNKRTGIKHWEMGISMKGGGWNEIEEAIKKSQTPIQQPNSQENDKFPFLAKLAIGGVIFLALVILITLIIKRNKKASNT